MSLYASNIYRNFTNGSGTYFGITRVTSIGGDGKAYDYPAATPIGGMIDNTTTDYSSSLMFPISNNRVVRVVGDNTTYTLKSQCGSYNSDGTITWGGLTTLFTGTVSAIIYYGCVLDYANGKIYAMGYADYYYRFMVIDYTSSGTTINTYGVNSTLYTYLSGSNASQCVAVSSTCVIQICLPNSSNGYKRIALLFTISGTTISYANQVLLEYAVNSANGYDSRIVRIDANRALYCYNRDDIGNNPVMAIVIKTNGSSTISAGNLVMVQDNTLSSPDVCCDILSVNGNYATGVIVFGDTIKSRLLNISDTQLSMNALAVGVIDAGTSSRGVDIYVVNPILFYIFINGRVEICKVVNGVPIRLGYTTVPVNYGLANTCLIKLTPYKFLWINTDNGNSQLIQIARPIGVNQNSTGRVVLKGVVKGWNGLIPNATYYTDGLSITTDSTYPTRIGMAISNNELLLDKFIIN